MSNHLLITGFTPFAGREENASWIAAREIDASFNQYTGSSKSRPGRVADPAGDENACSGFCDIASLRILELPVIWGEPEKYLRAALEEAPANIIIAMGEGREHWIDLETLACNRRAARQDNTDNLPECPAFSPRGPETIHASFDMLALQRALSPNFPVRRSRSAGGYLCEETLYHLECLKAEYKTLQQVLFVHLPPLGTRLRMNGAPGYCDSATLRKFGEHLVNGILQIISDRDRTVSRMKSLNTES